MAVKPKTPLNVVLSAVVINGDSKVALLRNARDGKTTRVYEGESVDGWELSAISPDRVSLTNGSETQDVELRKFRAAAACSAAPTASPKHSESGA